MDDQKYYRYSIYALFLFSGISGLIYQIVWTRMLVLVFGNTMLATSTVLSAFMGGLAAGSYVLGKYIDKKPRPLIQVYAVLEAGIGIFALLFPLVLDAVTPVYSVLYSAVEGNIILLNLVRFAVCFIMIGVPTFLMGGTLPVLIKRFTGSQDSIGHQAGFLYGLNTIGAVAGTFACGYVLLRILGMQKTTWVAVAINLTVAIIAWFVGRGPKETPVKQSVSESMTPDKFEEARVYGQSTIMMVLIGVGLSGFCALAYEVLWTRMLNLFLHNNIYSFTAILATFLIGIAVGSLIYSRFLYRMKNQITLFIWLQLGIGIISYCTPFIFSLLHSSLFDNFNEALTLAKTAVIMIGPTIMMGIAVPLAIQICRQGVNREGTSVGTVYAVNTVGAILGAFIAGFILLPSVGLHLGVIIVASLNLLAAFLPRITTAFPKRRFTWGIGFAVIIAILVIPAPSNLFQGLFQKAHSNADIVYYKEGKIANIIVYDFKKLGYKDFHLNAVNEASSRLWHVQLFKLLGLLPTLLHDEPTDALMVAFGAGMSAGACAANIETIDVVDLNPDIHGVAEAYTRENLDVINQPNFNQVVNDGRNALLLSDRKYSLIISDATNPKMFDSWTLYSQEFYQLVKDRLKPDGIFCQWALIPLPGDAIKVILNTFRSVFPHMSFWVIHGSSQVLMLGTPERLEIDYEDLKQRLEPLYEKAGLAEFGIDSPEKLLSFFIIGEDGVAKMLDGFDKVSTDDLPHAQFHIEQDVEGVDRCLDLVRFQESITSYMKNPETLPDSFKQKMTAYEDIARRLDVGFLTNDRLKFAEAAVVAYDAGLDDANVAHHLQYCPEKKRYFLERVANFPDDITAHNWLGNIHLLLGEYGSAEQEFLTTLKLKPDHSFARLNLAMTYLETGRYDEAVDGFLEAKNLTPTKRIINSTNIQLEKIRLHQKISFQPNSPKLIRELGLAYYNEGRILDAVKIYRDAIENKINDAAIIYNLARICENHEYVSDAAKFYTMLSEMQPNEPSLASKAFQYKTLKRDPIQLRDWLNKRIGKPASEENIEKDEYIHPESCDKALAIWNDVDPDGSADSDQLRRAAELYEQSTKTKPDDLHAYTDAALIFEALREYKRAAGFWEEAFKIRPDKTIYKMHQNRLESMAELNNPDLNNINRTSLLRKIGQQYHGINQSEQALDYLYESVSLDSSQEQSWLAVAEIALEIGQYQKALDAADRALLINPESENAKTVINKLSKIIK